MNISDLADLIYQARPPARRVVCSVEDQPVIEAAVAELCPWIEVRGDQAIPVGTAYIVGQPPPVITRPEEWTWSGVKPPAEVGPGGLARITGV